MLLSAELMRKFVHRKEIRVLTFWALALHQNKSRNCGLYVANVVSSGATLLVEAWEHGKKNKRINKSNEKDSSIPWGLRVLILETNFCSKLLRLSVLL